MNSCRCIRPWLEWFAAGEISEQKRLWVEAHLRECPVCRREAIAWTSLLEAVASQRAAAERECRDVDWQAVSQSIMRRIDRAAMAQRLPSGRQKYRLAALSTAAVLLLAAVLGVVFWLWPRRQAAPVPDAGLASAATITHWQERLAQEEVISYLQQSQLMFTDLLNDCSDGTAASREIRLYSRQARSLLMKKKYFQQNLPALEWLKVRNISERIDWLNYEILQLDDRHLCSQIGRLQQILESERLLLKIRLLEKDLTRPSYREV
jgi:hypothetical protein